MEPAPLWASSYTQYLLYKTQDPFSASRQSNCSQTVFVISCRQFGCRTTLCFTDQETQEENFQGGTSSLVGQFLQPISLVQSLRSIQHMQTVQLSPNTFLSRAGNLNVRPVSGCRQSNCSETFSVILCRQFGFRTSRLWFRNQGTQDENL